MNIFSTSILFFIIYLAFTSCSNSSRTSIKEIEINNSIVDSVLNFGMKEEASYLNDTLTCGLIRFSELNTIFQIDVVITDLKSLDCIESKFFPRYFFYYKDFPVFIINKTFDKEFFKATNRKRYFEYPRKKVKSYFDVLKRTPPEPPYNFEPPAYVFIYYDGHLFYQRTETFIFERFKDI